MARNWLQLGLIGYPVSHSLSPRLHAAALQVMGLPGKYQLYPVPPLPEGSEILGGLLDQLRSGQIDGLNVTVPHKESVLAWVDQPAPLAQAMGAVNTLYMEEGCLVGENTDGHGFWSDLCRVIPAGSKRETALILGAGGSARAVAYILNQHGYQLAIAARRPEQAQRLRQRLGLSACSVDDLTPAGLDRLLASLGYNPDLLVNCTPLGMHPHSDRTAWPEELPLPVCGLVYDLVYNPAMTSLVRRAIRESIPVANGLGMLVEQAALALERWTGMPVPRQAMYAAVPEYHLPSTINSQDEL